MITPALGAVRASYADGITYVLAADDPYAAIDLDHCRDPDTRSIDIWAHREPGACRCGASGTACERVAAGRQCDGITPYVEGLPSKQMELEREMVPSAARIGIWPT